MRIFLLFLLFLCGYASGQNLPEYITTCVRTKPDFHQCCIDSALKAIPHLLKGDKRHKVPPLAPLKVPQVSIQSSSNLKITLKDITIRGIETVQVQDVIFDFKNNQMNISLLMDYLMVLGKYEIDGQLLVPLRGNGNINITTIRSHIQYLLDFSIIKKGGQDYMQIEKDEVKLRSEKIYYNLDNLFGNPQLSEQTNRILNENAEQVGNELNGPVTETIRSIVHELITNYLTQYPLDQVFLKE